MTINDTKFEKEFTRQFKIDISLTNSLEHVRKILMGSFYPKQKMYEFKIYRGVMCHDNEELRKFEEELTCQLKID